MSVVCLCGQCDEVICIYVTLLMLGLPLHLQPHPHQAVGNEIHPCGWREGGLWLMVKKKDGVGGGRVEILGSPVIHEWSLSLTTTEVTVNLSMRERERER